MFNFDDRRICIVVLRKLHRQIKRQYLAGFCLLASITFPVFFIVQQLALALTSHQVSVLSQESALDDIEVGSGKYLGINKAQQLVQQRAVRPDLDVWKMATLFGQSPLPKFVWLRPAYYVLLFFYTLF